MGSSDLVLKDLTLCFSTLLYENQTFGVLCTKATETYPKPTDSSSRPHTLVL